MDLDWFEFLMYLLLLVMLIFFGGMVIVGVMGW